MAPKHAPSAVASVEIVEVKIEAGPKARTLIRFVLLDAEKRRVLADGQTIRYSAKLRWKRAGKAVLQASMRQDGIYTLRLPRNKPAAACQTHIWLYFNNGTTTLEHWTDDWLAKC